MRSSIRSSEFSWLVVGIGLVFAGSSTAAEFTIENRTSETAHVALGFSELVRDPVFGSMSSVAWTEGWFDVEPGQTRTITTKNTVRHYYAATASRKWIGDVTDWVKPRVAFTIKHPVTEKKANEQGWEVRGFIKVQGNSVVLREPDTKINVTFSNNALVAVELAFNGNGSLSEFFRIPAGRSQSFTVNVAAGFDPFVRVKQPVGAAQDVPLKTENQRFRLRQSNNRITTTPE